MFIVATHKTDNKVRRGMLFGCYCVFEESLDHEGPLDEHLNIDSFYKLPTIKFYSNESYYKECRWHRNIGLLESETFALIESKPMRLNFTYHNFRILDNEIL